MGHIINGKYYKEDPKGLELGIQQSSTYRNWSHDQQRMNHQKDILQPYNRDGKPNPEFIREYPEESKTYFTQEQLNKSGV